jgi:hypothetical protein
LYHLEDSISARISLYKQVNIVIKKKSKALLKAHILLLHPEFRTAIRFTTAEPTYDTARARASTSNQV